VLEENASRQPGLDAIRFAAILLVLGRHLPRPESVTGAAGWILDRWQQGGWVGVDLFFVLSGFLVAGLLFAELRTTGRIRVLRFYGRRGFKIYPAFYVFIAASALLFASAETTAANWISEILFVQNYSRGIWGHTWSLAVEEHFYLLLPPLLLATRISPSGSRRDGIKVVAIGVAAAVGCLAMRIFVTRQHSQFDNYVHLFPTHLRVDALMCGVVLAWFWHFRRATVCLLERWRIPLFAAGVALLLVPFVLPLENAVMHSVGLTTNYLGAALVVLAVLLWNSTSTAVRAFGWFGPYTYSIYLWHELAPSLVPANSGLALTLICYVGGALALGWATAKLVESPALRLRERVLPRTAKA
jgi:peptidoglycan/LPS O-acetylase OafA/YrhL